MSIEVTSGDFYSKILFVKQGESDMGKHTELPWEIREPNGQGNGFQVGPVWVGGGLHDGRGKEDAELVHVATAYHALLVEALRRCVDEGEFGWTDAGEKARALLAQLDGELE